MSAIPAYDRLSEALSRLGYTQDAAEYHGALCGALCVREPAEIDPLAVLQAAEMPADVPADAAGALRELCDEAWESFNSADLLFAPLLPDDEEDLALRVRALSAWCEGFLFGLSTGAPLDMKKCSAELKEIVRDFTEFTRAGIDEGGDAELEEGSYAELVEYVRVGAQLVYMELNSRQQPAAATPKLH